MTKKIEENFVISEKTGKKYFPTIGLEIHAELRTNSKMFCSCKNDPFNAEPNTHICEVCTAQPGTLPVVNKEAVKKVLKVSLAIGGEQADFSEFDRKNYFYPDIPKAYQISQYKYPLNSGGELVGVKINRIHLEEDTASSVHKGDVSLVDFNRAGVPLMELVTEPVIYNAETAMNFARELQLLLRTLGVSYANLEKGEMRIEANVSVSEEGNFEMLNGDFSKLGTKTEVKNLNSFKIVGAAIDYEIKRQIEALENGEEVVQETRGWDENKNKTFSQRKKENSDDYRYFPDPDIPKYKISEIGEFSAENLRAEMPELPWEKRERYGKDFGLNLDQIEFFLQNPKYDELFAGVVEKLSGEKAFKLASNYISSDIAGLEKNESGDFENFTPEKISDLIKMIEAGEISSRGAKEILAIIFKEGGEPKKIADEKGLIQKSDPEELKKILEQILADNPAQVEQYKNGEEKLLQFFIGQGMKATKGSANPGMLAKILKELLG